MVSVLNEDKYFSNDLLEQVQVQLSKIMDAHDLSLGPRYLVVQTPAQEQEVPRRNAVSSQLCGIFQPPCPVVLFIFRHIIQYTQIKE